MLRYREEDESSYVGYFEAYKAVRDIIEQHTTLMPSARRMARGSDTAAQQADRFRITWAITNTGRDRRDATQVKSHRFTVQVERYAGRPGVDQDAVLREVSKSIEKIESVCISDQTMLPLRIYMENAEIRQEGEQVFGQLILRAECDWQALDLTTPHSGVSND